ncbi:17404_t:CDS:2, partial [Racocetra fulgida]
TTKLTAENTELKDRVTKLEQIWTLVTINDQNASSTKDKKSIITDFTPEPIHSSTQLQKSKSKYIFESLTESVTSITSLQQDIVDDDLASVLEFVETIYKENVAPTISHEQKKEQGLIQEISAGDSQDDAFPSTQDHDSISPEYSTEILLTSDDLPKTDVGEETLPKIEVNTPLPAPSSLSDKPENEVIEVRNHLLATYFLYNTFYELEHEIDLDGIKTVHRIMLKDTSLERIEFGEDFQRAGEFRKTEVEARGSIYTVYPSQNSGLHPLIIASRILSTFLHVHPFADGNGRVGRSIMALYLIRNGLPPVVFQDIPREEYTSTLFLAQAEKDSIPLYALVVQNIFNILMRYQA